MFLHTENRELLWNTLQKSPYLVDFSNKFAGYREAWFQETVETFYTQWISQNNQVPNNARELLEINKSALKFMISDIKRILGYPVSSQQLGNAIVLPYSAPTWKTALKDVSPYTDSVVTIKDISSYNVSEERQRREEEWSSTYNKYQSNYNRMLERPSVPINEIPVEIIDAKIVNIDDLVNEHTRMRNMDLTVYANAPSSSNSPSKLPPVNPSIPTLTLRSGIAKNAGASNENINTEIERVEMEILELPDFAHEVTEDSKTEIFGRCESNENPVAKSVHWSENLSENQ